MKKAIKVSLIAVGGLFGLMVLAALVGGGGERQVAQASPAEKQEQEARKADRQRSAAAARAIEEREDHARRMARGEGITMQNYSRLETGMTYSEAVKILGKDGEEMSSSDIAGYRTVMYMWKARNGIANMNAMFQNGKLINKAQFGLN